VPNPYLPLNITPAFKMTKICLSNSIVYRYTEMLALDHPPQVYYDCEWVHEPEGSGPGYKKDAGKRNKPMISGGK
jgi:hypothetical protein